MVSPRKAQSPENDVMLQWAERDACLLVVERVKRRCLASWVSQEGYCVGLAVTSVMCTLKVRLSPLHQWNERLVLPFLFHYLELFTQGFHEGHHSLLWSPQMLAEYVASNVSVIYWFHYSWKSCGKSLNHWPLGQCIGERPCTPSLPYPTVSRVGAWALSWVNLCSNAERQFPQAANQHLSGTSAAAHNTLIFPFVLCLLSFDDLPGHPNQRRSLGLQSRHLAAPCAVA